MDPSQGVQTYRATDLGSMPRGRTIVLLYERIVSDLNAAIGAIARGDRVAMSTAANHSQRIVSELHLALDHESGGDIARDLGRLYDYLRHEHLALLGNMDPTHARNCLRVVAPLLAAWRQVPVAAADGPGVPDGRPGGGRTP
jgi:flagellar protein FliS